MPPLLFTIGLCSAKSHSETQNTHKNLFGKSIRKTRTFLLNPNKTERFINKMSKSTTQQVKKQNLYLSIYSYIKNGMRPSIICTKLNISKQRLQYHLSSLKEYGFIRKIAYGTWIIIQEFDKKKYKKSSLVTTNQLEQVKKKEVRGHAFIWKVKLPKISRWKKRKEILDKLNIKFKPVGIHKNPRIMLFERKIWLCENSIVIYEPSSFIADNAIESKKLAVFNLLRILNKIESKLKISLRINKNYKFKVSRQHYALMKNVLAIQCDKEGKKIKVYDAGNLWFLIDNSYNLHEAETVNKDKGVPDNIGLQRYFNSHRKTKFEVTPEFILTAMNGITQNQLVFDKNMSSHLKVLQDLSLAVDKLTKAVSKTKK